MSGGGGLVQTFQRSYSMMELSEASSSKSQVYRGKSGNIIHENDDETLVYSPNILKSYKSEEFLNNANPSYASLKKLRSPDFVRSNESISSGYGSDNFMQQEDNMEFQEYNNIHEENRRWEEKLESIMRAMKESKHKLEGEEIKIQPEIRE